MDFYDYYKLMGIPFGSEVDVVQKAYALKLLEYQSSQFTDDEKMRYLQVLNHGFELLSDPLQKRKYDELLKEMYLKQGNAGNELQLYKKYGLSGRNPLRNDIPEIILETEDSALLIQRVKHGKWMLLISAVAFLILLYLADLLYLKPYSTSKMMLTVAVGAAYLFFVLFLLSNVYKFLTAIKSLRNWNIMPDKWLIASFFIMFFAIPASFYRVESMKEDYELENYGISTHAERFAIEGSALMVWYRANGILIAQSIYLGEKTDEIKKSGALSGKISITYSKRNPEIIRLNNKK